MHSSMPKIRKIAINEKFENLQKQQQPDVILLENRKK
jgi:hypothetical protein